jgi:hypothetical protein
MPFVGDNARHTRQTADGSRIARRIAPHDDDLCRRVMLMQPADRLPALGVPFHRHGAGVDDADVGAFVLGRFAVAVQFKGFLHELAFVLVDFATECQQANGRWGHWRVAAENGRD